MASMAIRSCFFKSLRVPTSEVDPAQSWRRSRLASAFEDSPVDDVEFELNCIVEGIDSLIAARKGCTNDVQGRPKSPFRYIHWLHPLLAHLQTPQDHVRKQWE